MKSVLSYMFIIIFCLWLLSFPSYASGPIMIHFPFDEGECDICKDISGEYSGVLGADKGVIPSWEVGRYGKALKIQVSEQNYVRLDGKVNEALMGTQGITLMAWIKLDSAVPHGEIINCKTDTGNYGYRLFVDPRDLTFDIGVGDTSYKVTTSGMVVINELVGTWTHVAATFDGQRLRVFINGELMAENMLPREVGISHTYSGPVIGKYTSGKGIYIFDGLIDEVKFFNFAMALDEIIENL